MVVFMAASALAGFGLSARPLEVAGRCSPAALGRPSDARRCGSRTRRPVVARLGEAALERLELVGGSVCVGLVVVVPNGHAMRIAGLDKD